MDMESIKGVIIKELDINMWDDKTFSEFFLFSDFFFGEDGKLNVNPSTVGVAEQYQDSSLFIKEMLTRIDYPLTSEVVWNRRKFFMRLNVMFRMVKKAIEKRPELLLPSLVIKQFNKKQYRWMNNLYNPDGIVRMVTITEERRLARTSANEITPSERLQEAMSKVADVYDMIAGTITEKEIKAMNVKDRINALNKLSYIHATQKKFKPNMNFIKINTKSGSAEQLENELLNFANDDEE